MSVVDKLIAESRKAGTSSGLRRFKLARQRAIAKMRKFALADPRFFILELIQSAIAHGAKMIHVESAPTSASVVYGGVHFRSQELSQVFDFLFAAKDDLDTAHLRDLAIGLNALLAFTPESLRVVSGDGTLAGSSVLNVLNQGESVEIGTPRMAVRGVHIEARGMSAPKGWETRSTVMSVVEERCMLTPVPIVMNGDSVSGFSSSRTLPLAGFAKRVHVDEGDLYGTIGQTHLEALQGIKLMVRGVWIETFNFGKNEARLRDVGGALSFDRLRKTADHSGIVRDERFDELLLRLGPYVEQLRKGETQVAARYHGVDGADLSLASLRAQVASHERIVCLRGADSGRGVGELAQRLGALLDAPVVLCESHEVDHLAGMCGGDCELVSLSARNARALRASIELFEQPPAPEPAKPWLIEPLEVEPMPLHEFASWAAHALELSANNLKRELRRSHGEIAARVYTSNRPRTGEPGLAVSVRLAGRVVADFVVDAAYPGHELVVDVRGLELDGLTADLGKGQTLARAAGLAMAGRARTVVHAAGRSAVQVLVASSVEPKTTAAYAALSVAARRGILRWEFEEGAVGFWFDLPQARSNLLDARLLRGVDGAGWSLRDVAAALSHRGVLHFAAAPDAALSDNLQAHEVLLLDRIELEELFTLIGEAALLSGVVEPERVEQKGATRCAMAIQRRAMERGTGETPQDRVFRDERGGYWTPGELRAAFAAGAEVRVHRADQAPHLAEGPWDAQAQPPPVGDALEILATPFEMTLLAELGIHHAAKGGHADVHDAELLVAHEIREPGLDGRIGIPATSIPNPAIILDGPSGSTALTDVALALGVVGVFRVGSDDVTDRVKREAWATLARGLEAVSGASEPARSRLADALLRFASSRFTLLREPGGGVEVAVSDPTARRVLALPLFSTPNGAPTSALQLASTLDSDSAADVGAPAPADPLARFVSRHLTLSAVREAPLPQPAESGDVSSWSAGVGGSGPRAVERHLERVIEALRVDDWPKRRKAVVVSGNPGGDVAALYSRHRQTVTLNTENTTVAGHLRGAENGSEESVVWLALLAYGTMNEILDEVTNRHERTFQQRVTSLLLDGSDKRAEGA